MTYAEKAIDRITHYACQTEMQFFQHYVQSTLHRNADQFAEASDAAQRAIAACRDNDEIKAYCLIQLALALVRMNKTKEAKKAAKNAHEAILKSQQTLNEQMATRKTHGSRT